MADDSITHLVVNSGAATPEVITGFGEGDRIGLLGFLGPELRFTMQDGGAALQVEVYEAGDATPAAVVLLVGATHALDAGSVLHW